MKIRQILATVNGIVACPGVDLELDVRAAFSADLMSDALRLGSEDLLLITGLTHPQAIRTAEMIGVRVLLFVRAKLPPPDTVALAREAGVFLLSTRFTMYEASGLLYKAGLAGLGPCGDFV